MNIEINNVKTSVTADETILQVAIRVGIDIPNMCYKEGLGHINSCMICMVKDIISGRFVPACSTKVADGMVIETDNDELRSMRREGLELLLSEHIGDCDAPCTLVCPAGINIPLLIRQVKNDLFADAVNMVQNSRLFSAGLCDTCTAPCERVCRRGRIDQSVSIRLLVLYIAAMDINKEKEIGDDAVSVSKNRFNSHFGKLLPGDEKVFLLEAADIDRIEPLEENDGIFDKEEAAKEATRCLHCDCRKSEQCKLRNYADEYSAKQIFFKGIDRGYFDKDDQHDDIMFERGKCIKCGICVGITKKYSDAAGLEFCGRGYDVKVAVPFGDLLSAGLKSAVEECVTSCPTGALAWKDE